MDVYSLKQVPSEAQIQKYLRQIVFGKNVFCPVCRRRKTVYKTQGRYRCTFCRVRFSLLSHTWLSNMKLPLQEFWLLLWCWTNQVPVRQTQALLGLSEKGVRHHFELLRNHLPTDEVLLEHMVQLDEAYFGGRKGYALMMGKEPGTRKLAYHILPHTMPTKYDASSFLQTYVKPYSKLFTDSAKIYNNIHFEWPVEHYSDVHKNFEFTNTSEIEGMFGVLRTFIRRMYHHVTYEKFPSIMCEFYYRFSHPEMFQSPYQYLLITLRLVPTG